MLINKSFKYRIYPTTAQQQWFAKCFGCARFIYNKMLEARNDDYKENGKKEDYKPLKLRVVDFKEKYPFLAEVSQDTLGYELRYLNRAYTNFFKNPKHFGFPKFKSKCSKASFSDKGRSIGISEDNKWLYLPKLKKSPLKVTMHRPLEGRPVTFTVTKTATNEYYISIQCEVEVIDYTLPATGNSIGLDLGLHDMIITSEGSKIPNPQYLVKSLAKLAKEQRILSRKALVAKKEGRALSDSKNYQKQRVNVAKIHEKVKRQRAHLIHNISAELVTNNDIIVTEDINITGLINPKEIESKKASQSINRAIYDVSWGKFLTLLRYKADWNGREFVQVSSDFPSSQICSCCGTRDTKKQVNVRKWVCPSCGTSLDRDVNASINILQEGLRMLEKN